MSLLERSKKVNGTSSSPSVSANPKPARPSLLERARSILKKTRPHSLLERAKELLSGSPPVHSQKASEAPVERKGMLERAKEFLFGKKKGSEPELAPPPELDEILENVTPDSALPPAEDNQRITPLSAPKLDLSVPESPGSVQVSPGENLAPGQSIQITIGSPVPPSEGEGSPPAEGGSQQTQGTSISLSAEAIRAALEKEQEKEEEPAPGSPHAVPVNQIPQRFQQYHSLTPEEVEKMPLPPLNLRHRSYDIVSPDGPHGHYGRNLQNAESFISEGDFDLAIDTYNRAHDKIPEESARKKIRENIEDIENYVRDMNEHLMKQPRFITMPPPPPQEGDSSKGGDNGREDGKKGGEREEIRQEIAQGFIDIQKAIFEATTMQIEAQKVNLAALSEKSGEGESEDTDRDEGEAKAEMPSPPAPSGSAPAQTAAGAPPAALPDSTAEAPSETGQQEEGSPGQGAAAPPESSPEQGFVEPPEVPSLSDDDLFGDKKDDAEDKEPEEDKVQEIRGVLELKPPDEEDTPFLTLTYDFTRIPHEYALAKDHNIFEFAYYKYKPMLVKAQRYIRRKQITRALNYYRVIREQQIPDEFRRMIDQNILDITEYLQKYLMTRQ